MMKKTLGFILFGLGVGFLMGAINGVEVNAEEIPYLDYSLNKIFFVEKCRPKSESGGDLVSDFNPNDVYNENATKIMTALLKAGYSKVEVAGVMGSLKGESGAFNPGEGENAYMGDATIGDKSFRVTSSPCYNRCGFGIAQWTSGGRQDRLQQYADSKNLSVVSLEAQTGYLIKELGEYGFGPGSFKFGAKSDNAESAAKAAVEVCSNYEIPGHTAAEARARCISRGSEAYGKAAYQLMQSGGSSGGSSGSGTSSREDGANVTIIGDSIVEGAKGEIKALMPKAEIDSKVGRQFSEGLTILDKLVKDSKLRKVLVFALGTNGIGTASASNIKKVIDEAGSDTQIVFVTNYTKSNDYSSNNNNFAKAARGNSNVTVVDWEALVSKNPNNYLSSDGVHPNSVGQKEFAKLIYDAISGIVSEEEEDEDEVGVCEDEEDEVCGGGDAIVKEAVKLAWPDKNHYNQINPNYAKAAGEVGLSQYGVNLGDAQDCGKYVAVVVRKAVDANFPACCTWTMEEYMANSSNWKEIPNESSESNMKPGDIMVVNEGSRGYGSKQAPAGGQGGAGHVQIYIGGDEKLASASLHSRTGNLGEYFAFSSRGWNYRIFRFVGSVSGGDNCSDGAMGSLEEDLKEIEKKTGHKVGVAVAAPGSSDVASAGSWGGRAWSTINVPLAVAAERLSNSNIGSVNDPYGNHCNYDGISDAIKAAISKSNNCAAWWLWQSVGGDGGSGANSVNAVLRSGGDNSTDVAVSGDGASLTASKTIWSLKDQAVFAANLSSVSGSGNIIKDMKTQNANDKKAGLNVFDKSISKGGWGSGSGAATRQFGLVKMSNGQCVAVAIGANYYDSSYNVLTKIAKALKDNESELPGGKCPKGL